MTEKKLTSVADHVLRHYGDKTVVSVDELLQTLRAEKHPLDRADVVSAFQTFHKSGLGEFVIGRRGRPSRMRWKTQPRKMSFDVDSDIAPHVSTAAEMLEYPLVMRPGVTARLVLPADLSTAESLRIAQFVQQLPVDAKG
jgi:hypothetical protein